MLAGAILAWAALVNGYPLLFNDSARYIDGGIRRFIPSEAPIFYGAFLIPFHLNGITLWAVPVVQGILVAYVLHATARAFGLLDARGFLLITAFLALFTALPWFISFVMPDVFTGICVLTLFALFRGWPIFGILERLILAGIAFVGLASHVSHLVLGLVLAVLFGALHFFGRRAARPALLTVLCLPPLALGAILGLNLVAKGRLQLTQDGPVMLLARSYADGPAYEYLRDHCTERQWRLCYVWQRLPRDSDEFLWSMTDSAWTFVPGDVLRAEAGPIALAAMRDHPGETLVAAVRNTLRQLITFRAGVDFKSWPEESRINVIMQRFFPREHEQYVHSLQERGQLHLDGINHLYTIVVTLSVVGAIGLVLAMRDLLLAEFLITVAFSFLVNAAATGALSIVADRYQARLIWLAPLALAICLLAFHRQRVAALSHRSVLGGDV